MKQNLLLTKRDNNGRLDAVFSLHVLDNVDCQMRPPKLYFGLHAGQNLTA